MEVIKQFKMAQARLEIARRGFPVDCKRERGISQLLAKYKSEVFVAKSDRYLEEVRLWVDDKDWGLLPKVDYEALYAEGTPAPYGHGEETKLDPAVRDAREIVASRFRLTCPKGGPLRRIWPRIDLPNLKVARQEPYKIQMYKPGGHFQKHRDTVHGKDHMATRVVFLPSAFEGGDLVVRQDGREFRINDGQCMFYTDCEHEVEPVTSGVRVTLQYDVFGQACDFSASPMESPVEWQSDMEYEVPRDEINGLDTCLERVWDEDEPGLCFVLTHSYTQTTLSTEQLRGSDSTLFRALKKLGYSPQVYACILSCEREYDGDSSDLVCSVVDEQLKTVGVAANLAILCGAARGDQIDFQRAAYTGNECVNGHTTYFSACLVIERPKAKRKEDSSSEEEEISKKSREESS